MREGNPRLECACLFSSQGHRVDTGIGLFIGYHSQQRRGHGLCCSLKSGPREGGLGLAGPCLWRGFPWPGSAAPELAAGLGRESELPRLPSSPQSSHSPDSRRQSRERLQNKASSPSKMPLPSSERARDGLVPGPPTWFHLR